MGTPTPNALVNEFFLIKPLRLVNPEPNTTVDAGVYQGQVTADLGDGYYLCQFFSWVAGEPTCKKITHISVMASWEFYSDVEMWREAGSRATAC